MSDEKISYSLELKSICFFCRTPNIQSMKAYKLVLIFTLLAFAIVATLLTLGIIPPEVAQDNLFKAVSIICIVGLTSALILSISKGACSTNDSSKGPGPNF